MGRLAGPAAGAHGTAQGSHGSYMTVGIGADPRDIRRMRAGDGRGADAALCGIEPPGALPGSIRARAGMVDLSLLLAPALAFLVTVGAPGPATLAVTAVAMTHGRRAALVFAAGLSLGLAVWGGVAAAGLGAAMLAWAPALFVFRLAGGAFLLWLAWNSMRSALAPAPVSGNAPAVAPTAIFRRGLLLNMLNPKAVLAWGAVIALGLPRVADATGYAAILAVCAAVGAAIYTSYALTFSLPWIRAGYAPIRRWVDAACAAVFGLVGVRLLTWQPEAP